MFIVPIALALTAAAIVAVSLDCAVVSFTLLIIAGLTLRFLA